jgi:hypothetical protein
MTKARYQHAFSFSQELEDKWIEFKKLNPNVTMNEVFEKGMEKIKEGE